MLNPPAAEAAASFDGSMFLRGSQSILGAVRRTRAAWPLLFATCLFAANNLNLVRAWLDTPVGARAMYVVRDVDIAQHLTWTNWLRDHWLVPNFHAPFLTTPGLFVPLMIGLAQFARLGADSALVYAIAQYLAYILGSYALVWCLRVCTASRAQKYATLAVIAATLPIGSFLRFTQFAMGRTHSGPLDVLVRDGFILQGPLTLTVGTVAVLLCLALVASYARTQEPARLYMAGAVACLAALLHPFEIFAIMPGATLAFFWLRWPDLRRALNESLIVCVPGIAGLLPFAYFSFRSTWVSKLASVDDVRPEILERLFAELGLPTMIALVVLVVGPRLRAPSDVVLQAWFAATLIVFQVPNVNGRWHLIDGFAPVAALLLVRQFAEIQSLRDAMIRRRGLALLIGGSVLGLAMATHAVHRYVSFRDGVKSSSSPREETLAISWLREHAGPAELVLAPADSAPWIATVPIHSFASHWLFSVDYAEQARLSSDFYSGKLGVNSSCFLRHFGVNYVIAPARSRVLGMLDTTRQVATIGKWNIYYFPENRMQPFSANSQGSAYGCEAQASY
jgi:glycerol uptake facilitator-like aquaporin